ncbi:MAG: ATP-binding protein [Bacteroidales bacterium]
MALSVVAIILAGLFIIINYRRKANEYKLAYKRLTEENERLLNLTEKQSETISILNEENADAKQVKNKTVSENIALQQKLVEARRIADEADMLKSNFLANMSHEIRTPMNGILGFAQLLQHEEVDKEMQSRYLDIISHNGTMLVNLIDDIMDISKIEAGQLPFNKTEVNLDNLMFDLYTFFNEIKFKQEKEHISIRLLNLNDDENSVFYTDEQRIRQVLTNLIGNSLKFTDKGIVEFGYINKREEHLIQFYVRDTGIGVPKDKQDLIFDRFRQVEEGSTRKYGGTGIGLFISKHIVDLLGGKIWLESEPNEGSTFYFSLPYSSMQQKDDETKVFEPAKRSFNWEDKVIVIAEDVETNYKFLKAILNNTQAELIWAKDGEEAVNICKEKPHVDVVLMDIQMPKLNGYEATAAIRKMNPNIRIIAQTAYAMPNDNIKCIEAGCHDYISKPINSNLLLEKIDNHLTISKD